MLKITKDLLLNAPVIFKTLVVKEKNDLTYSDYYNQYRLSISETSENCVTCILYENEKKKIIICQNENESLALEKIIHIIKKYDRGSLMP